MQDLDLLLLRLTVAEWAKGALTGIAKGAPFSLSVTKHHFATVAAAANSPGNDLSEVCGYELRYL